jgi:hypothetical protein
MYRLHELGDCFLLMFTAGSSTSRMLIDCGSFRNSGASVARLEKIAGAIKKDLAGAPLNVVVGTHQHNDHLSGFVHCEPMFRQMGIEQVWLSWLDNPTDKRAQKIGEAHHNLVARLHDVRSALRASFKGSRASRPAAVRSLEAARIPEARNDARDARTPSGSGPRACTRSAAKGRGSLQERPEEG